MTEQAERTEGPPAARLLRDFVNTREPQVGRDDLGDPAALRTWFAEHGLPTGAARLEDRHVEQAIDLREGLRAVFSTHAGHDADAGALARLNAVLADFPVGLRLEDADYALVPSAEGPLAGPVAGLADAIRRCHEDGTWVRLKVCARDTCRWAFYDASRNQVRRWCSMAGCGNHVKMKRAYARRTGSV